MSTARVPLQIAAVAVLVVVTWRAVMLATRVDFPRNRLDAALVYAAVPLLRLSTLQVVPSEWADDSPFEGDSAWALGLGIALQVAFWLMLAWRWVRAPRRASPVAWIAACVVTSAIAYGADVRWRVRFLWRAPTCDAVYVRLSQDLQGDARTCAERSAARAVDCLIARRRREVNPRNRAQPAFTQRSPEYCQVQVLASGGDSIVFLQAQRPIGPIRSFRVALERVAPAH